MPTRRAALLALSGWALAGCGGGGSSTDPNSTGRIESRSVVARSNGTNYPLNVYLPPGVEADRTSLPVVYLLDGESRFGAVVAILESTRARAIVVGIGNEALRSRDYVPFNTCTANGGGQAAFFDFIRLELVPFVETTFGGDPTRRILLGHSHGGSFVLYALFAEAAADHRFDAYLASDASIDCMSATVYGWESAYAAANAALPVRLHVSYSANLGNAAFVQALQARRYAGLRLAGRLYAGGHIGMIPEAFGEALAFALGP
jgi:hypothetical protein